MSLGGNVRRKKRLGGLARALLDGLAAASRRRVMPERRSRIGIFLFWGIGDAVQTLPLLQAIRQRWPEAEIVGLGKPWLAELFDGEALFDSYADLVPPWTRHRGKYRVWDSAWRRFAGQIRSLRAAPFDLLVGLRPDPRDVVLARLLRSQAYAGLAAMGAGGWVSCDLGAGLTDLENCPGPALAAHAARMLTELAMPPVARFAATKHAPAAWRRPVLAVAFGASHPIRRWNGAAIERVLNGLGSPPGTLVLVDQEGDAVLAAPSGWELVRWQGNLRQLKAMLASVDLAFCTDSGVMHIADAAGAPVTALFTSGNIGRFAPPGQAIYAVEPMPCRPCGDHCIYSSPRCVDLIDETAVSALLRQGLTRRGQKP